MANFRYLLDTNIVSELIKNPQGRVAKRMLESGLERFCCTSIIVACELRYGAVKKQSSRLSFNVEQVLNSLPILSLNSSEESRCLSFEPVFHWQALNTRKLPLIGSDHDQSNRQSMSSN